MKKYGGKIYLLEECVTFRKTREEYGGLSNMASGYPIYIGKKKILTSEALYQACRFPDHPEIQEEIINQKSPITAKKVSRKYEYLTRKDWMNIRIPVMNWCIHMKLLYNWSKLGNLFKQTKNKEIVELSSKDDFWGAYEKGIYAEGYNVLGILLKQLREDYRKNEDKKNIILSIPRVENFRLFESQIKDIKVNVTNNYHIGESYNFFYDFGLE